MYRISDAQPPPAICKVRLKVQSAQRTLVVGRTGSGKSSLVLTLLRLLDMDSGHVEIDGLNIARVSREALRTQILIIPQDPVELPGSVHFNLAHVTSPTPYRDPTGDDQASMQRVLERVGLWDMVSSRGVLDAELDSIGFSGGQKQLFSLARTILLAQRRQTSGGLMLLDEPASSVDDTTSKDTRRIVREELAGYTIVMISHRLDAMEEADAVVRMESGRVVEVTKKKVVRKHL
jgi:ATP-binding cassette, subfamily C (CFTR/MRP), member 1